MRAVLAFDLATQTGWASTDSSGLVQSGSVKLKRPNETSGKRALQFANLARDLMDMVEPQFVAYEEVRAHSSTLAAHCFGGLEMLLLAECERRKIPVHGIPVGTIKKHATGRGDADKDLMVLTARAKWRDLDIIDDNQADALWIMDTAQHTL